MIENFITNYAKGKVLSAAKSYIGQLLLPLLAVLIINYIYIGYHIFEYDSRAIPDVVCKTTNIKQSEVDYLQNGKIAWFWSYTSFALNGLALTAMLVNLLYSSLFNSILSWEKTKSFITNYYHLFNVFYFRFIAYSFKSTCIGGALRPAGLGLISLSYYFVTYLWNFLLISMVVSAFSSKWENYVPAQYRTVTLDIAANINHFRVTHGRLALIALGYITTLSYIWYSTDWLLKLSLLATVLVSLATRLLYSGAEAVYRRVEPLINPFLNPEANDLPPPPTGPQEYELVPQDKKEEEGVRRRDIKSDESELREFNRFRQ